MWALLRTGRWIGFTITVVFAIVAFGVLSAWQWSRAEERRAERLELTALLSSPPQPLAAVGPDQADYTRVTVNGAFVEGSDRLVRSRPQGGGNGFWVVSALEADPPAETYIWVVRGWMPSESAATAAVEIPAAAAGEQQVEGYLRSFEDTGPTPEDLPTGQVTSVSLQQLPRLDGTPYPRWVQSARGEGTLEPLVLPEVDDSRNVSYAVQWLLFAAVAIAGWFLFLRREARDDAMRQESESAN